MRPDLLDPPRPPVQSPPPDHEPGPTTTILALATAGSIALHALGTPPGPALVVGGALACLALGMRHGRMHLPTVRRSRSRVRATVAAIAARVVN